jgi:hypothetical protein
VRWLVLLTLGVSTRALAQFVAPGGCIDDARLREGLCPVAAIEALLELGGCGASSALDAIGDGVGVAEPFQSAALSLRIAGAFVLCVQFHGALSARLGIGAMAPLSRIRSTIQVGGAVVLVHEAAPVVPEGSPGLELWIR